MNIKNKFKNIKDKFENIKLNKIINYEILKKENVTLQQKAIKALVVFLVVMMFCTILSRIANTLTVPVVKVSEIKSKTIDAQVAAEGRVVKNHEQKVKIAEELKVNNVNVNIGSNIKVGQVLAELDLDDIKEKVSKLNKEIEKEQRIIARAQEDYDRAVQEKNNRNTTQQSQTTTEQANTAQPSTGQSDSDAQILQFKRALQDAKDNSKLEEYNKQLSKLKPYLDSEGKVISKLDGVVTSIFVQNGTVTKDALLAVADTKIGYKFVAQLESDKSKSAEQGQKVEVLINDKTIKDLTIESVSENNEGASDKESESNKKMLNITVNLPIETGKINDVGKLILSNNSKNYDACIPISALRQDGDKYYVLVASEEKTVLGKELVAKKVNVKIIKKDGSFASIEGINSREEKIIIDSNKKVNEGDKVRLEE